MIEVDIFWSFAIGGCLASISSKQLFIEESLFVNSYFMYCLCFLSIFFAPSGIYLLWEHTGWETMFVFTRDDLSGTTVAIFASTNVLLGVFGFIICGSLIKKKQTLFSHSLWILSYHIMFAILGFGYKRFTYSGNSDDWINHIEYPISDFIHSKVFNNLLIMGLFIIPSLYYPIIFWPGSCGNTKQENRKILKRLLSTVLFGIIIGCIGYFIWITQIASDKDINNVTMTDFDFIWNDNKIIFGKYSPLIGFILSEIIFMSLVIFPFILSKHSKSRKFKKKKNK